MPGGHDERNRGADASRSALDFVHGLLAESPAAAAGLDSLLTALASAFAAPGAGIAVLPSGKTLVRRPAGGRLPWDDDADLIDRVLRTPTALAAGGTLATAIRVAPRPGWLLWLYADAKRPAWTGAEAAALALAGQALARRLDAEPRPRWAAQMERAERQHGLEVAARVTARLAHDFGNVLTGIIGFCDLSLALKAPPDSQVSRYLRELQRCAHNGADLTNLLRLFSRRQAGGVNPCEAGSVAAEEAARFGADGAFAVRTAVADGLPPSAIDAGQLRQVLAVLLENARDAMQGVPSPLSPLPPVERGKGEGASVSVRRVDLGADDCLDLYGDPRPGPHVEIAVSDSGPGLSAEAAKRLFAEPFFTAKPRRRGFGLAVAYGIVHAHHGGIRLRPGASGGTVAEVYLPVVAAAGTADTAVAHVQPTKADRVLVVDDDPNILRFICATLERAGYRTQGATSADEAYVQYAAAAADRFRLVLSDLVMPRVTGVDLARRLLAHDAGVHILFMSGQTTADIPRLGAAGRRFEFLSKPFRPDGLLRAVRGAIDRLPAAAGPKTEVEGPKPAIKAL